MIKTSSYVFPLWTANRRPRKLGRIVAERARVWITDVPGEAASVFGKVMGRMLGPADARGVFVSAGSFVDQIA